MDGGGCGGALGTSIAAPKLTDTPTVTLATWAQHVQLFVCLLPPALVFLQKGNQQDARHLKGLPPKDIPICQFPHVQDFKSRVSDRYSVDL